MTWKSLPGNRQKLFEFIFTALVLTAIMLAFTNFLQSIEQRKGVVLQDPLLNLFNPIDLTWLTFALIYFSIILFLTSIIRDPEKLIISLQTYGVMIIFRSIAIYLIPLDAPEKLLVLNDPFVQFFGEGEILTKDLFFSGHTATLFLLFLLTESKKIKTIFLICTIMVGWAVLIQHVHYSIDVFAAPFFAYSAFIIISNFHKKTLRKQTDKASN